MKKILLAGESWTVLSIHQKGFDTFNTCTYEEGGSRFIQALEKAGFEVCYMPCHIAAKKFPDTQEALSEYAAVILSDIGANTLLLRDETFIKSEIMPNRLNEIKQYVEQGGAFAMMGGYLSFSGIDAKAQYKDTAIEEILPVNLLATDDRVEIPEGTKVAFTMEHEVTRGIGNNIPLLLGYNKLLEKAGAEILLESDKKDILLAVQNYGKGRTAAFASDIAPHWAPQAFLDWEGYDTLFSNLLHWMCRS